MKRLIIIFLFILLVCCSPKTYLSMSNEYERNFTYEQFDSICKVDTISNDLNDWHNLVFYTDGYKGAIKEYMYIKYTDSTEIIYRLMNGEMNTFRITKRIVQKSNEK